MLYTSTVSNNYTHWHGVGWAWWISLCHILYTRSLSSCYSKLPDMSFLSAAISSFVASTIFDFWFWTPSGLHKG